MSKPLQFEVLASDGRSWGKGESLSVAKTLEGGAVNKAAQALGRKAKGVSKHFTKAELARLTQRLALARAKRWPKKGKSK